MNDAVKKTGLQACIIIEAGEQKTDSPGIAIWNTLCNNNSEGVSGDCPFKGLCPLLKKGWFHKGTIPKR